MQKPSPSSRYAISESTICGDFLPAIAFGHLPYCAGEAAAYPNASYARTQAARGFAVSTLKSLNAALHSEV